MISNNEFLEGSVDALKRKLISIYVYLMFGILLGYGLVFYFILKESFLAACTFIFAILLLYTFLIIGKNYKIERVIHIYMSFAPLYVGFVMLYFWKYSGATAMWLLPIPLGAHIFLKRKYIYIYTSYIFLVIVAVSVLTKFFTFDYFNITSVKVIVISDTFVGLVNLVVFGVLIHYNEKIRKAELEEDILSKIKKNDVNTTVYIQDNLFEDVGDVIESYISTEKKVLSENENIEKYIDLFEGIKYIVEEQGNFKNTDFSISQLSDKLKTNNSYVSKSIKLKGFSNFNHYLNTCRVEYVKKLLLESDISKVTLMYIYTESGFSNQSTFNRVFKQIEGTTPSEFIITVNSNLSRL